MNYKNGDYYEGDWKNNIKEGNGKMNYKMMIIMKVIG